VKYIEKLLPLIDTPHTHNKLKGGRGGGKSYTVGDLIALIMSKVPLQVLCSRETQKSLKESSYSMLKKAIYGQHLGDRFTFHNGEISSAVGGRCVFIGLKEHTVDSIKSYTGFHWSWTEEAHAVSAQSLETLVPTLREDGYFQIDLGDGIMRVFPLRMFIYTMNPFSWADPVDMVLPTHREDVQEIIVNHDDNPYFPKSLESERVQQKETLSTEEYNRIWRGIPFDDGERGVLGRQSIEDAMNRVAEKNGDIHSSADIARYGSDKIVFMKRDGNQVIDMEEHSKMSTVETAYRLNDFAEGGDITIDDTGVGGGVTDKLEEIQQTSDCKFTEVKPINFAEGAEDKLRYKDIISEMWFSLKDKIDIIGLPNHDRLKKELISRNYSYLPDGRRKVESKEEYKKRTKMASPDYADAAIMLFYDDGENYAFDTVSVT